MILTCYYDLRYQPITFDFAIYLAGANAYAEEIKATKLAIKIIFSESKAETETERLYNEDERAWRKYNILDRLPTFLSKTFSVAWSKEPPELVDFPCYPPPIVEPKEKSLHYINYIEDFKKLNSEEISLNMFNTLKFIKTKFFKSPEVMKSFSAPAEALKLIEKKYGLKYITVSLRTSRFQAARNSNIQSWKAACDYIFSKGLQPIIIPDFEDYFNNTQSFTEINYPVAFEAIFDVAFRMALYQNAKHNLSVSKGANNNLLFFSKASYSIFKFVVPGVGNYTAQSQVKRNNLNYGEKFFFMDKNQHLLWTDDSKDFVMAHLKHLLE